MEIQHSDISFTPKLLYKNNHFLCKVQLDQVVLVVEGDVKRKCLNVSINGGMCSIRSSHTLHG